MSLPGAVTLGKFFCGRCTLDEAKSQRPHPTYVVHVEDLIVANLRVLLVSRDNELMASLDWDLLGQLSKTFRPEIASDPHPRRPGSDQYGSLGLSR